VCSVSEIVFIVGKGKESPDKVNGLDHGPTPLLGGEGRTVVGQLMGLNAGQQFTGFNTRLRSYTK
jgi:hypothetical protein